MRYFKTNYKKNISGRMSLYSVLSIITAIMICAAAWNLLDLAKNIYRKNFKGSGKKTFQEKTVVSEPYQQNFFYENFL